MSFNCLILIWFDANRRNLPWRGQTDPYLIWISEIILQQTRVAQGTVYYQKFVKAFPTVQKLASADPDFVLKIWQGLGYYSRARNMQLSAQYISSELNGKFPDNYKELLKLRGVGPYTAAAIASICFDEPVPAIDGNAFRVLARYFDIEYDISDPASKKYFTDLGSEIIDRKRPGDFNQAVMELGAMVCLPKNPKCGICPLEASCAARAGNKTESLPVKTRKPKVKNRKLNLVEVTDCDSMLMVKRKTGDIWRGLYCFPDLNELEIFGDRAEPADHVVHLLTHRRLEISFLKLRLSSSELEETAAQIGARIVPICETNRLPVPKPIENYLKSKI